MSFMPDTRVEARVSLPGGGGQLALRMALAKLYQTRPDLFAEPPRHLTTRWDTQFVLSASGGDYLAELIEQAKLAEQER